MSHVIIDRRLNTKGKSSVNRQKFLERVRHILRQGAKELIKDIDIADVSKGGKKIKMRSKGLDEPTFSHDEDGVNHRIITGNDRYVVGDRIPRPEGGAGKGNQGSKDGEGEDDYEFSLSREEFLDLYYENCELPFMIRKQMSTSSEQELQRHGYRTDGSPSTLNIVRTMRQAKSRKYGFRAGKKRKIVELEKEFEQLQSQLNVLMEACHVEAENFSRGEEIDKIVARMEEITTEIELLKEKIKAIPFIDPIDQRYNAWSLVDVPAIQAVMFCILDVSGSMDEEKKRIAKTFFMLLYLFLERNYDHVEIVFIRHHTEPLEVTEEDFFHSKESGGTLVSPAIQLMMDIIDKRYSLATWNIFVAQGSDGDNWGHDNPVVTKLLQDKVLPSVQYYAYAQINPGQSYKYSPATSDPWNMWGMFHELSKQHPNLGAGMITDDGNVYEIFKKLFEKRAAVQA